MDIIKNFEEEMKKREKKEIKQSTLISYIAALRTLLKLFNNNLDFLKNPEDSIKIIEEKYKGNINTISNKISIIILLFQLFYPTNEEYKSYYKTFVSYRDKLKDEREEKYKLHEPTVKQVLKSISKEENEFIKTTLLSRVKRSIKDKNDVINLRNFLIYMFLDYMNSRCDFITSRFAIAKPKNTYDPKINYIVLNKCEGTIQYIQNDYKTSDKYKQQIHDINNGTYKYFVKLLNAYKKLGVYNGYAFLQEDMSKNMNENNLSKLYSKIGEDVLKKPISIQVMRVQGASDEEDIKAYEKISAKAKRQGHSMTTHTNVYMKKNINK